MGENDKLTQYISATVHSPTVLLPMSYILRSTANGKSFSYKITNTILLYHFPYVTLPFPVFIPIVNNIMNCFQFDISVSFFPIKFEFKASDCITIFFLLSIMSDNQSSCGTTWELIRLFLNQHNICMIII